MILTEEEVQVVVRACRECIRQQKFPDILLPFAVLPSRRLDFDTFQSIFGQVYIRHTKKKTAEVERNMQQVAKMFDEGKSLLDIAAFYTLSPYKLAKLFVKHILNLKDSFNLDKLLNNEFPLDIPHDTSNSIDKRKRLESDLIRCCLEDSFSSQAAESLKNCVGKKFEDLLYDLMTKNNMCFETESELRLQGKPKTPDVLLTVPLAVRLNKYRGSTQSSEEAIIVHWIDSKAMFGDKETFQDQLEQLHGYVNRYGRGLVIYWHGFVETLPILSNDIAFSDCFPEDWVFPVSKEELNEIRNEEEEMLTKFI